MPASIQNGYKDIYITAKVKRVIHLSDKNSARVIVSIKEIREANNVLSDILPITVRLNARNMYDKIQVGDVIGGKASIFPLPQPVVPDQHDFARDLLFSGIEGVGYFTAGPYFINFTTYDDRIKDGVMRYASQWQNEIYEDLNTHFDKDIAGLFFAILSGNSHTIPFDRLNILRETGLAHILAVSGFHMGVVTGVIFWLVRLFLSFFRRITLTYPIKKISCFLAITVGSAYLIFTQFSVSATRAWIMVTVMFVAIIMNKKAFQLHNVALAACIIVLLTPQAALSPGFQMSFLVVLCLVSANEMGWFQSKRNLTEIIAANRFYEIRYKIRSFIRSLFLVSLIAWLASLPIVLLYFKSITLVSIGVNFIVLPLVTCIVIPSLLFYFILLLMNVPFAYYVLFPAKSVVTFIFNLTSNIHDTGYASLNNVDISSEFIIVAIFCLIAACLCRYIWQKIMLMSFFATLFLGIYFHKPVISFFVLPLQNNIVFKDQNNTYCYLKPIKNTFLKYMLEKYLSYNEIMSQNMNTCQIKIQDNVCYFSIHNMHITVSNAIKATQKEQCVDEKNTIQITYRYKNNTHTAYSYGELFVPSELGTIAVKINSKNQVSYTTTQTVHNETAYGFRLKKRPWE